MEVPEHYTLILVISSLLSVVMLYIILRAYHKKGVLKASNVLHTVIAALLGFAFARVIYIPLIMAAKYALSLNSLIGYLHFFLMLLPVIVPILIMEIASHNAMSKDMEVVDSDEKVNKDPVINQIYSKIFFFTSTITIVLSL